MPCELLNKTIFYKLLKMPMKTDVKVQTFFEQCFISIALKMCSTCTVKLQMVRKRKPYHSDCVAHGLLLEVFLLAQTSATVSALTLRNRLSFQQGSKVLFEWK